MDLAGPPCTRQLPSKPIELAMTIWAAVDSFAYITKFLRLADSADFGRNTLSRHLLLQIANSKKFETFF